MDLLVALGTAAGYVLLGIGLLMGLLVLAICALLVGLDRMTSRPALFWWLTIAVFLCLTPAAPLVLVLAPVALLSWAFRSRPPATAPTGDAGRVDDAPVAGPEP